MPTMMELTDSEAALVLWKRARDKAEADGSAALVREQEAAAARAEEQARQAAEEANYTPEQRAILALPPEQQQALAEHRALVRLQELTATKTALVAQATAAVESAVAETRGVSGVAVELKG